MVEDSIELIPLLLPAGDLGVALMVAKPGEGHVIHAELSVRASSAVQFLCWGGGGGLFPSSLPL